MAFLNNSNSSDGNHWISVSDMMAGLMMVFLFIAISYMVKVKKEKDKIKQIAVTYNKLQNNLYEDLYDEFEHDLEKWNAEIDSTTISVRFKSPEILFEAGSDRVRPKFKTILDDFFPRYLNIITKDKYINDISEVRIEGHTSSEGKEGMNKDESYLYNMTLSQNRAFSTLSYIYNNLIPKNYKNWSIKHITANGLSFSKKILNEDSTENRVQSRRVEFRVKTDAEKQIVKILNE
jgi:outer membrane protein OmpA-like peptidoglycan-associated protein